MATRKKIPHNRVPIADQDGMVTQQWYQLMERDAHVGDFATAAAAGAATALPATPAGYYTVVVGGTPRLVPFYKVP